MTSICVPIGTPVSCNRCYQVFLTTVDMERTLFNGQPLTRLTKFCVCPFCNMNDSHWVRASDLAPTGVGLMQWAKDN